MLQKIVFPILLSFVLIAIQLVVIPFFAVYSIVPNVVLIYLLFFSVRNGQIPGTIFAFFIGFVYDLSSGGLLGSGMFAFTLASFVVGYFYRDDFTEVIKNIKTVVTFFILSSFLFFLAYSVLGNDGSITENYSNFFIFALFSSLYTTIVALSIYLFRWNKL